MMEVDDYEWVLLVDPKMMPYGFLWNTSWSNMVEENQNWFFVSEKSVSIPLIFIWFYELSSNQNLI